MFADIFKNLLNGLWSIAKLPVIIISVLTAIIIILYISFFMYYKYIKKVKTIKADVRGERIKNENIVIKIIKAIKILTALIILKWKIQITTMKDNTLKNSGIPKTGNFLSSLIFKPLICYIFIKLS